jgi:hypothetical protein
MSMKSLETVPQAENDAIMPDNCCTSILGIQHHLLRSAKCRKLPKESSGGIGHSLWSREIRTVRRVATQFVLRWNMNRLTAKSSGHIREIVQHINASLGLWEPNLERTRGNCWTRSLIAQEPEGIVKGETWASTSDGDSILQVWITRVKVLKMLTIRYAPISR